MKKVNFGSTSIPCACAKPGGEAHATAGKAPARIRQSTSPVDVSKKGSDKPWPSSGSDYRMGGHLTSRNKEPGPPKMDYGMYGSMFDSVG
jgi:hypothetical protein